MRLTAAAATGIAVFAASSIASPPSQAQTATLALSASPAFWHETVVATIGGVGCSGPLEAPRVHVEAGQWVIDLDVSSCDAASTTPFALVVELPELLPQTYQVRVRGELSVPLPVPPALLTSAELIVARDASLAIHLPDVVSSGTPIPIELTGLARSGCYFLEPPALESSHQLVAYFADDCPIIPFGGRHVFREPFDIGPLDPGTYELVFRDATYNPTLDEPAPFVREQLVVHDAALCVPSDTTLCLGQGRFAVAVEWLDFAGQNGVGHPVVLPGRDDSGLFWFFDPANIELTVKVLDGCGVNGAFWVFIATGSTVQYEVLVSDLTTGETVRYGNALGEVGAGFTDTSAFDCP